MAMIRIAKKKLRRRAKFTIRHGQRLAVVLSIGNGMSVIHVWCDPKGTRVDARARCDSSGFEFSDRKQEPRDPDFCILEPRLKITFGDRLRASYWGQFGWGELDRLQNNKKFMA